MAKASSKYVQLTPYALLEYQYNNTVLSTNDVGFLRIKNSYTGSISYLNFNPNDWTIPKYKTGNVIDRTVQQISESTWAHFDMDKPITYFENKYRAIYFEHLWHDFPQEINITYDSVKLHLQAGYNFSNLSGFILRVGYSDSTNQTLFVANIGFLKEDELIEYHKNPISMGDRIYDRYVQVKVPSLNNIIEINAIDKTLGNSLSGVDGIFIKRNFNWDKQSSKINVLFYEIKQSELDRDGSLILRTPIKIDNDDNSIVSVQLNPFDEYFNIGAIIKESLSGDYFELYPTYNESFFDNFIFERSQFGEDYLVIHEVEVYEQSIIGGVYQDVLTFKFNQFQEEGFDKPFLFRPIIKDNNSLSFSINYTVRILNKIDNSQIIRRSSISYPNARKYGRWMPKLSNSYEIQPVKIVNKILKPDNLSIENSFYNVLNNNALNTGESRLAAVPIDLTDICINSNTLYVDNITNKVIIDGNKKTTNSISNLKDIINSDIIYGQGEGTIYLNEFDNFIKFNIYKYDDTKDQSPVLYKDLDSSANSYYYLTFILDNDEFIKIPEYVDYDKLSIEKGAAQLLFKIDTTDAVKILKSSNRTFTINLENLDIIKNMDGSSNINKNYEVVLYTGRFDNLRNYTKNGDLKIKNGESLLNEKINEINTKLLLLKNLKAEFGDFLNTATKVMADDSQKKLLDDVIKKLNDLI